MTDEPISASEVEKRDDQRSPEEIDRARARRAVASRVAKRHALKKAGAQNVGNPALVENIEAGLRKRDRDTTKAFRARKAAEQAVAAKRGK